MHLLRLVSMLRKRRNSWRERSKSKKRERAAPTRTTTCKSLLFSKQRGRDQSSSSFRSRLGGLWVDSLKRYWVLCWIKNRKVTWTDLLYLNQRSERVTVVIKEHQLMMVNMILCSRKETWRQLVRDTEELGIYEKGQWKQPKKPSAISKTSPQMMFTHDLEDNWGPLLAKPRVKEL